MPGAATLRDIAKVGDEKTTASSSKRRLSGSTSRRSTVVVSTMELYELLRKAEGADVDFLREGVRTLAQALMEVEVAAQIGAEHGERAPDRVTHRNGYRPRDWDTRVGTVELQVPKLRQGSYFPSLLEPRRRAERALAAVVMQCYVEGVS